MCMCILEMHDLWLKSYLIEVRVYGKFSYCRHKSKELYFIKKLIYLDEWLVII
jgi:hypothetical protein